MKEEIIEGDLYIHGDLNCGTDGILEADGNISWGWKYAPPSEKKEKFNGIPEESFELEGRHVIVHGNVMVWGLINYDQTWKGRITADT